MKGDDDEVTMGFVFCGGGVFFAVATEPTGMSLSKNGGRDDDDDDGGDGDGDNGKDDDGVVVKKDIFLRCPLQPFFLLVFSFVNPLWWFFSVIFR